MTEEEQNWYSSFVNVSDEEATKMFETNAPRVSNEQYWYILIPGLRERMSRKGLDPWAGFEARLKQLLEE